jgi:hypothetical protein
MKINEQANSLKTHDHVHHAPNIERKKEMKQNKRFNERLKFQS